MATHWHFLDITVVVFLGLKQYVNKYKDMPIDDKLNTLRCFTIEIKMN